MTEASFCFLEIIFNVITSSQSHLSRRTAAKNTQIFNRHTAKLLFNFMVFAFCGDDLHFLASKACAEVVGTPVETHGFSLRPDGRQKERERHKESNCTEIPRHSIWKAQVVFEQNVTTGRPQPFTGAMATCSMHMVGWKKKLQKLQVRQNDQT